MMVWNVDVTSRVITKVSIVQDREEEQGNKDSWSCLSCLLTNGKTGDKNKGASNALASLGEERIVRQKKQ